MPGRRLPAEVLYDAIHRATGSVTHLPGMPASAARHEALDSNVEVRGRFEPLWPAAAHQSACSVSAAGMLFRAQPRERIGRG